MRKAHIIFILTLLMSIFFCSCGKPKPTAADFIEAMYNLYILGDTKTASDMGLSLEDIKAAMTAYDAALQETIRTNFSDSGLEIDETSITLILDARKYALSKMSADFTVTSQTEDTAIVTISTTYFDELAIDTNAAYQARKTVLSSSDYKSYSANMYSSYIMKQYTQNLITGYENVTPSEDRVSFDIKCIIANNIWVPEDMADFGTTLGLSVSGRK